jgi:hypothetical protein
MFRKLAIPGTVVLASMAMLGGPATAAPPVQLSGAIFTTDKSGTPVNLNIYDSKEDVYLNGGPGINAPDDAAGLPAGTYSFQVTDPSGKVLLSTDPVSCRQFTVDASGVIQDVSASGTCAHATGDDEGEGTGISVQLFPYNDTPNNGGVYKVWVTPTELLAAENAPGSSFGFVPRYSKTDNFKVRHPLIVEIDVRFWKNGNAMDGYAAHWTDTLGASNTKYSEYNPAVLAFHEAHFEAVEPGNHGIRVESQPDCTVASVLLPTGKVVKANRGWADVSVAVANHSDGDHTYWVDVTCA